MVKIARNTVTLAYPALADDGYLTPKARSGYVVNEDAPVNPLGYLESSKSAVKKINWEHRIHRASEELRVVNKPLNWREYDFPFVYGQADFKLFSHFKQKVVPMRDVNEFSSIWIGLYYFKNAMGFT